MRIVDQQQVEDVNEGCDNYLNVNIVIEVDCTAVGFEIRCALKEQTVRQEFYFFM